MFRRISNNGAFGKRVYQLVAIYRVIQEERSKFWEKTVSVIVRKNKLTRTSVLIMNGY